MRQRDFLSKKYVHINKVNKSVERDRDDLFLKIQNENTNLIKECNNLRKEKQAFKLKVILYSISIIILL